MRRRLELERSGSFLGSGQVGSVRGRLLGSSLLGSSLSRERFRDIVLIAGAAREVSPNFGRGGGSSEGTVLTTIGELLEA